MPGDPSAECRAIYDKCDAYDKANNVTEPDFDHGCWKYFLDLCVSPETQCPRTSTAQIVPLIAVAVLSVAANSLVCVVFMLYRQLQLIRHYFVVNLAIADILIAAMLIPLYVAAQLTEDNGKVLSICQFVLDITCGTASILCLAAISLERYVAVKYSLHYHSIVTHRKAFLCMVFIWVYSVVVSCAALLSLIKKPGEKKDESCFFAGPQYATFVTFASFVLPVAVMVFAYWNIFKVAQVHARRINSMQLTPSDPAGSLHSKRVIKRELKGAKTLTIIMGTHFICWCPLFVFFLVYTYCQSCRGNALDVTNYIILVLRYCNSLTNPLIYSGINKQFRAGIKRFLFRRNDCLEEMQNTAGSKA